MAQLMAYYGIVEEIEMFPKFAFVKYKKVEEATKAFEKAEEICQRLGSPQGFRIFFSDPSRRAYVVSNHYEYDKQSAHVPVVFLGFPPITSATIDLEVIRPVVQKIAPVMTEYMRKNTNSQNRSYFLFSFDSVKTAIKVKQELNRRKDLLGDKRAEVAVLLDESAIMKGKDLSHTQKMYQSDSVQERQRRYPNDQMRQNMMQPMGYMSYPPNRMYPMPPYMPPPQYYPPSYYYEQQYYKPEEQEQPYPPSDSGNIHDLLKDVLASESRDTGNEKKPVKSGQGREEDILTQLLGSEAKLEREIEKKEEKEEKDKKEERQPSWSGFLTWKGSKRVGVDGHSNKV